MPLGQVGSLGTVGSAMLSPGSWCWVLSPSSSSHPPCVRTLQYWGVEEECVGDRATQGSMPPRCCNRAGDKG